MTNVVYLVIAVLTFIISFPLWVKASHDSAKQHYRKSNYKVDIGHISAGFLAALASGVFWPIGIIIVIGFTVLQGIAELFDMFLNPKKKIKQKIKSGDNSVNIQVGGTIYGTGTDR